MRARSRRGFVLGRVPRESEIAYLRLSARGQQHVVRLQRAAMRHREDDRQRAGAHFNELFKRGHLRVKRGGQKQVKKQRAHDDSQ